MLQVTEDAALRERIAAVLTKLHLPTAHEYPAEQLMEIISHDKKHSGNKINLILVKTPGQAEIVKMPLDAVQKYL